MLFRKMCFGAVRTLIAIGLTFLVFGTQAQAQAPWYKNKSCSMEDLLTRPGNCIDNAADGYGIAIYRKAGLCWLSSGRIRTDGTVPLICDTRDFSRLGSDSIFLLSSRNDGIFKEFRLTTQSLKLGATFHGAPLWLTHDRYNGTVQFTRGTEDWWSFVRYRESRLTGGDVWMTTTGPPNWVNQVVPNKKDLDFPVINLDWLRKPSGESNSRALNRKDVVQVVAMPRVIRPQSLSGLVAEAQKLGYTDSGYDVLRRVVLPTKQEIEDRGFIAKVGNPFYSTSYNKAMVSRYRSKKKHKTAVLSSIGTAMNPEGLDLGLVHPGDDGDSGGLESRQFDIDLFRTWNSKVTNIFSSDQEYGDFSLRRFTMDGDILIEVLKTGLVHLHLLKKIDKGKGDQGPVEDGTPAARAKALGFRLDPLCVVEDQKTGRLLKPCKSGNSKGEFFEIWWTTKR